MLRQDVDERDALMARPCAHELGHRLAALRVAVYPIDQRVIPVDRFVGRGLVEEGAKGHADLNK